MGMKYYTIKNLDGSYMGGLFAYDHTVETQDCGVRHTFQMHKDKVLSMNVFLWNVQVVESNLL